MTGFFEAAKKWKMDAANRAEKDEPIAKRTDLENDLATGSVSFLGPRLFSHFNYLNNLPSIRGTGVSVSSMYYMCPRQVILALMFPKKTSTELFDAFSRLRMGFGTWAHSLFQNEYLGDMRVLYGIWRCSNCKQESRLGYKPKDLCPCSTWCLDKCLWPEEYIEERDCGICGRFGGWDYVEPYIKDEVNGIKGKCDGIIVYHGRPVALEIKTKNGTAFDKMTKPDEAHILQLNMYLHYLQLDYGLFMYVRKGEVSAPKEFLIKYDPDIVQAGMDLVKKLNTDVREGNLPEKVCDSRSCSKALKCPWRSECFSSSIEKDVEHIKRTEGWPSEKAKKKFPAAFHSESSVSTLDSGMSVSLSLKLEELKSTCSKLDV